MFHERRSHPAPIGIARCRAWHGAYLGDGLNRSAPLAFACEMLYIGCIAGLSCRAHVDVLTVTVVLVSGCAEHGRAGCGWAEE